MADRKENKQNSTNQALKNIAKEAIKRSGKSTTKGVKGGVLKKVLPLIAPWLGILLAVQIAVTLPFLAINTISSNKEASSEAAISNIEAEQAAIEFIGKEVSSVWKRAKNNGKKALNFLFGTNLTVGIKDENFVSKVDEGDVYEILEGAEDYEQSLNAMARVIDLYLQDALDHRRQEVSANTGIGITVDGKKLEKVDYALTLANFDKQGNPFANVNYAALIAAYAASDYQIDETTGLPASNVKSLIQKLKNGEPAMLDVEYTYIDPNTGEQFEDKKITPVPIYKYEDNTITVNQDDYLDYLKMFEKRDPKGIVKNAVLTVLGNKYEVNTKNANNLAVEIENSRTSITQKQAKINSNTNLINSYNTQKENAEEKVKRYQKKADEINTKKTKEKYQKMADEAQKEVDDYNAKLQALYNENSVLQNEINALTDKIPVLQDAKAQAEEKAKEASKLKNRVANDEEKAKVSMIEKEYMTQSDYDVVVKSIVRDANGKPKVDSYIQKEEGEVKDTYEELSAKFGKDKYGHKFFVNTGKTKQYPEIETLYYATVELKPYSSTDVFKIFDIDPDAVYEPSAKYSEGSQITYRQRYNQYYDTIYERCENLRGATFLSGTLAHACSLSTDEIKAILDAMPANTSGNRKEFIKNLLYLVGAIPYEYGGDPTGPGWNNEWWQPTSGSKYKGLDCSSYVQWGVWTTFGSRLSAFDSTRSIYDQCTVVDEDDIIPGDLALHQGTHVAIFIGYKDGQKYYVHLGGGSSGTEPPELTTSPFISGIKPIFMRMTVVGNLEGSELYKDEITPFGVAAGDELYVITKTLIGECGDGGDGFLAVAEACHNHAISSNLSMYEQVTYGNGSYLEAYKRIFVKGENYAHEPTAGEYAMIQQVMAGQRTIFPGQNNVMYWRAKGYDPGPRYTFVKNVGGNDFYYAK